MSQYRALYRETRPEVFSEILGQDYIVKVLRNQVSTGKVGHAYLFCGTRGTGKTTTARILAKAVNCEEENPEKRPCGVCPACRAIAEGRFIDVIEIDAASNNGVDNIRELRENVNYPPVSGRKKVYIIDEVHMLSAGAFNALLKTLEEPPEDVIFILATTNPEKLPQTVLSRCVRFDFRRVGAPVLAGNIRRICEDRGIEVTEDALRLLTANADGSVRDSLSLLEQCISSGERKLTRELVLEALGTVSDTFFTELTDKVIDGDISEAFILLDSAVRDGSDVRQLMCDWMSYYRSILIAKFVADPEDMLNMSRENIEILRRQSRKIGLADLNRSIVTLAEAVDNARYSTQARTLMEVAIVTIAGGGTSPEPVPDSSGSLFKKDSRTVPSSGPGRSAAQEGTGNTRVRRASPQVSGVEAGNAPASGTGSGHLQRDNAGRGSADVSGSGQEDGFVPETEAGTVTVTPQETLTDSPSGGPVRPADGLVPETEAGTVTVTPQETLTDSASGSPVRPADAAGQESASEETQYSPSDAVPDLQRIWLEVFEELEPSNPKLYGMSKSTLDEVGSGEYRVISGSNIERRILKSEQEIIDSAMSKRFGRPLRMVLRNADEGWKTAGDLPPDDDEIRKIAETASEKLGVKVRIVDGDQDNVLTETDG